MVDPDEIPDYYVVFNLGLQCLPKYAFRSYRYKGFTVSMYAFLLSTEILNHYTIIVSNGVNLYLGPNSLQKLWAGSKIHHYNHTKIIRNAKS